MQFDVIIVGASYAGLSAAMQLARARRTVLVLDKGVPRNRFASEAHGFFGQDGKAPFAILKEAVRQLTAYPTVEVSESAAIDARSDDDGFAVHLADGSTVAASRLVLATGVRDVLPGIAGVKERWGVTVLHCPYCHGYEVMDKPLGVLATDALSFEQGMLIPDWGPTTYFTQGLFEPEPEQCARLARRDDRAQPDRQTARAVAEARRGRPLRWTRRTYQRTVYGAKNRHGQSAR